MRKSQALAKNHQTHGEEEFLPARHEPEGKLSECFSDFAATHDDTYAEVQREFGWDDTH